MTIQINIPDPYRCPAQHLRQTMLNALLAAMPHYTLDNVASALAALSDDVTRIRQEVGRRQLEVAAEFARLAQIIPAKQAH